MTGIQWTGDNTDEMFHYVGKNHAVVLIHGNGDTIAINDLDIEGFTIPELHVGDWLYREAGGVFAVPNDSRWALDSLTRRADADKRFRDKHYDNAMQNAEPAVHPFYTHGRYGYGDKVTWQGKPALVVGYGGGIYNLNVLDTREQRQHEDHVISFSPGHGAEATELTPGWPA